MNVDKLTLRRATLDDLPQLRGLWALAKFPVDEYEKRFTEFQVAEDETGSIVAIMALYHNKQHGLVHSEIYRDPEWEPALRSRLWQRVHVLAKNHGLLRLWTQSSVSFWREQGWKDADFKALESLPPLFGHPHAGWLTLGLINDALVSVEKEFEMFAQAQRESTQQTLEQARKLKTIAVGVVIAMIVGLVALAIYTFLRLPRKK